MKKFGFGHRALALLLVVVMTLQLLPLGVLATFGDLQSWDPGVQLDTMGKQDAINWPIKVYDYLSDGMLFEWFDTNTSASSSSPNIPWGNTNGAGAVTPYGGGYKPPVTALGLDFTYGSSMAWGSDTYSPRWGLNNKSWGTAYKLTQVDAVDYSSPMYMRIQDGSSDGRNLMISRFAANQSTSGKIRYMTLVYRCKGLSDDTVQLRFTNETSSFTGVKDGTITIKESTAWAYQIIDLYSLIGSKTDIQYIWFTCYNTKNTSQLNKNYAGMDSGDYLDLAYIGYFNNTTEANNYAKEALKFIADPGEYLAHASSTTYTHSYVSPIVKPDALNKIFSLNYRWKVEGKDPHMYDSESNKANVTYGMDFTTHSVANGWKTNAYTSETFWTWSNGTNLQLKNTLNGHTNKENFTMSRINVDQMTQSNGAQFVRLTNTGPSKILLSKFREDHQLTQEGYVPLTEDVGYMVLVYRGNGLDSNYKYGLWAHGYLDSSSPDSHKTANYWKYAGLTKKANWLEEDNINQLSFSNNSGWQYVIIPLMDTIKEKDPDMESIDRIANLGLYLPTLSDGRSLDIAYVAYFKQKADASKDQRATAEEFGAAAVAYMNTAPKITTDVAGSTKSLADNRVWHGGGNKSFGMLYSSNGGKFLPNDTTSGNGNSGGESTSTNDKDYGYEFDTWMIGYRTNAQASNAFNAARYNLVYNSSTGLYEKVRYTAKYTPTGSSTSHDNVKFQSGATGTTNNIFFLAATEENASWGSNDGNTSNGKDFDTTSVPFDGYQLLETITSGVMTAGLLEGGLQTVKVNGINYRVPVYRQETVEYIAYNLLHGLRIPMRDSKGNYNTRFIKGTASTKYGGVDMNGDGEIGWINYDGDSRNGNELNEASVDLATALRHELGLNPRMGNDVNVLVTPDSSSGQASGYNHFIKKMGNYTDTMAKSQMLYGDFSDCRNAIETAMDAAYYLLNNIFIANSYNQKQDDYDYLRLDYATVSGLGHSGDAYVFDAGFTTGKTAGYGTTFTDNDGTNKSAIKYDPYTTDGKGTGMIAMDGVTGKTRFDYGTSGVSWTTRFPFLPITDAEGDFAGETKSYYFLDDAQRVYTEGSNSYKDRNFNYVIASNGEFVYREEDDLFFEFEGDDDVYLFINGELVLDIGGAHSITSVYIDVNDYVAAAAAALKPLEAYGYYKDMSIAEFEAWISAANIEKLDAKGNPTGDTVTNPYDSTEIASFKRWHRLNLSDGQICQFDFYYMERHGWGANMRIVTNMHITDPSLSVDKSAHQFGEEIEYGGVIDPSSAVEYNFTLTNTGNTKLYNLNWVDETLGITMDPVNGLQVDEDLNGIYVMKKGKGPLQAKDLTAVVSGYDDDGNYVEVEVIFPEEDDDGGQKALKRFLWTLEAEGTESGLDDAEVTHAGSGLWVDASVTFKGIYYLLTPDQVKDGKLANTVKLTATTRRNETDPGCRTLRSDASHLIYTNGFPIHYQWAGKNIFMNLEHLLKEAKEEAQRAGSQLSLYQQFFKNITMSNLATEPCDKFGRVGGTYPHLTKHTDDAGHTGYLINYEKPGVYVFYLLMYNKSYGTNVNASDIAEGDYAILRSQVYVADVEDSVYVLDYGLNSASLDQNGELFKNDYLFGPNGNIRAKLMGVTGTQPSFIDPEKQTDATKTGINFAAQDVKTKPQIMTPSGFFNVNLAIPEEGKNIAYDSITGQYTLTGVGTVTLNVEVPATEEWKTPYLHYWYDDNSVDASWPGFPLTCVNPGKYKIDIPANVTNVIVNNGSGSLQTKDLKITAGLESTIKVTVDAGNQVNAEISTIIGNFDIHASAPQDWGNVYLHYWNDSGEGTTWPGIKLEEKDSNGYYIYELPSDTSYVILNDGGTKSIVNDVEVTSYRQTGDLDIYMGREVWVEANETLLNTTNNDDGSTTSYYGSTIRYTLDKNVTYTVHASVPSNWGEKVYLYYWHSGSDSTDMAWPGIPMTKGSYFHNLEIPGDVTNVIVTDGMNQTVNLSLVAGLETWIMLNSTPDVTGKYTATIHSGQMGSGSGLNFTPRDFINDKTNMMWLALTVHSASVTPSPLNSNINIHNEVQMFKQIRIVPATVVYYEDDFAGIQYNKTGGNTFTYYGEGSDLLSQSVDQSQAYGQDSAYQDSDNNIFSGDSLTSVKINTSEVMATFTFRGTGFELISRTNAVDTGTVIARVYDRDAYQTYLDGGAKPEPVKYQTVITQFDQSNDGGSESIDQVPVIRISGLPRSYYTVELSGVVKNQYCGKPISSTVKEEGDCYHGDQLLRTCSGCGKTWETTAVATGHNYRESVVAPTCTKRGYTLYTCLDCGDLYADNETAALEHEYSTAVFKPTCTKAGYEKTICVNCGKVTKVVVTPATGHSYENGVCTICGDGAVVEETRVYFKPNAIWMSDNARFAAYFFGGSGDTWVGMEPAGDGYYSCVVPDGYDNVIFCRMDPATSENSWNTKWNQTGDLILFDGGNDSFVQHNDTWDGTGDWCSYNTDDDQVVEEPTDRTVYFKPNSNWSSANARFAVYYLGGTPNNFFEDMTPVGDYYMANIPANSTYVIFLRMNPETTENNWNDGTKWGQTGDLRLTDGNDCFVQNGDTWDGTGNWVNYTCVTASHDYADSVTVEPGCNTAGERTYTCTRCGDSYTEIIAAADHNYVAEQIAKATCDSKGWTFYCCSNCGDAYVKEISATEHNLVDGTCKICGFKNPDDCEHKVYLNGTCVTCGAADTCSHSYASKVSKPTCSDMGYTTYTCSECGHSYVGNEVAALGHNYVGASCATCGEDRVSAYHYEAVAVKDAYINIDGLRIYQPLDKSDDYYSATENGAKFLELRDLIVNGQVAVATVSNGSLKVSSGTTSWSENLAGGDFDKGDMNDYVATRVESADDYLIKGPNNEVYMEGTTWNSALAFYIKEVEGTVDAHALHVAVRALDYAEFYGSGTSPLNVQLQLGIVNGNKLEWMNLAQLTSGTEQYYNIPYTRCPKDSNGNYQIVIRAVNAQTNIPVMVSYSNAKLINMEIQKVQNVGESSILYYLNGLLVKPTYYLNGTINGETYDANTNVKEDDCTIPTFVDNKLSITFDKATEITIRRDMGGKTLIYSGSAALGNVTSTTLFSAGTGYKLSVPAGDVTFKIVQKENDSLVLSYCAHTWNEGVIIKESNCTIPGTRELTCTKCGEHKHVDLELNPDEHVFSGGKCKLCGTLEPKFYLIGWINGANYGCEEDYANMGEYLFVDGKLVATFTEDSYVFVKADGNAAWYMINAAYDQSVSSAVLHPTTNGYQNPAKMFVPAGEEITFTLVDNGDGTLTLSYALPCPHEWDDGVTDTEPSCTEAGFVIHTCALCGKTKTVKVPAIGHKYENGYCVNGCGSEDPDYYITLYYKNTEGWENVSIWAWNAQNINYTGGTWPGQAMTKVEGEEDLYSFTISKHAQYVIFNNGGKGAETTTLTIPTDGRNMYYHSSGAWLYYGEDHVEDYYLIGYINGADHGSGGDWMNNGDYKFINGQIVVNFTADSYLGVKSGKDYNNYTWYWTESYVDNSNTATLVQNGSEKLKVPAGEWKITLVDNGDGTLTLSYGSTCEHNYESVVTEPTCTDGGYTTYTCSICGDHYQANFVDSLGGHDYVGGSCVNCGIAEPVEDTMKIYFQNNWMWSDICIYYWGSTKAENPGWPGYTMSCYGNDGINDIYVAEIPTDITGMIINGLKDDGSGNRDETPNIKSGWYNGICYYMMWDDGNQVGSEDIGVMLPAAASLDDEVAVFTRNAVAPAAIVVEDTAESVFNPFSYALNLESILAQMNATSVYGVDDGEMDDSIGDTEKPEVSDAPEISVGGASLAFKEEIYYNVYFQVSNPDNVAIEELGLVTWTSDVDGTVSNGEYVLNNVVLEGNYFKARSQAITAKHMAEELYFKVYAKLANGEYVYTDLLHYSAKTYAANKLKDEKASDSLKALCVALMNYGAAAQEFFSYKTEELMNANLTDAQKALVENYSAAMIPALVKPETSKVAGLSANGGFSSMYPSVNFGGAFGINYIFTPDNAVDGDMKLYVWTAADYAKADELTLDNASQVLTMEGTSSGVYSARLTGIAAKNVGDTVYACGVYESNGVVYRTGVLAYSVGEYCRNMAQRTDSVEALAKATAVYTYYARLHLLGA